MERGREMAAGSLALLGFGILMGEGAPMNLSLSPDLEESIRRQVASGRYGSAEDVVRDALGYLLAREERLGELRAALAVAEEQIARGDVVTWTPELHAEILEQAKEAARAGARPKADVCP